MISDELFRLAFEYRKTKLWHKVPVSMIFAVKLAGGEIGYISIVDSDRANNGLELYIGEKGFRSLCAILEADTWMSLEYQERLIEQQCLLCTFEMKHALAPYEREEVANYTRSAGIKLAGKNAYPQFIKCTPGCYPWRLEDDGEKAMLCEALAAAIELSKLLEKKLPIELGLMDYDDEKQEIACFEKKNGRYELGFIKLPKKESSKWPAPQASNDIGVANLKKMKKTGIWECGLLRFYRPIQNEGEEIPVYPIILLALDISTNYILPVDLAVHYEENPEELLNFFINALIQQNICPKKIKVRDDRTYTFFKMFCEKLKISLSMEDKLPTLEDAEYEFYEHFYMDEEEVLQKEKEMMELGYSIEWEETEEKSAYKENTKVTSIYARTEPSYVISVSLGAGCYRHIQISGQSTLYQFHRAILDAFQFDDDHAHAFFMDNVCWSQKDCYYTEIVENGHRTTEKCKLNKLGLQKDDRFKYLFDFGDEWTFQCKVLRVLEEQTPQAIVIKSKGEAPEQYGAWD